MAREVATTSPIPRLTTRRLVPVSASASVTTQACHGAHPTDGLGHHRRSITPENHLRFPIVNPGEGEGGLPDDVVAISVATYSDDPGAFAAYGLNGGAGPFVKFAELLSPAATVLGVSAEAVSAPSGGPPPAPPRVFSPPAFGGGSLFLFSFSLIFFPPPQQCW